MRIKRKKKMSNPYNPTKSVCTMFCKRFYIEAFSTLIFFFGFYSWTKNMPQSKEQRSFFWSCNCWFGFNGLIENSPNYQSSSPYNGQEGRWIRLLYFFIDEREARNSTVFCDVSYIFFYSSWLEIRRYFFQHKWTVAIVLGSMLRD